MLYSIFGISISLSFFATSCKEHVDYRARAKWIYINETSYNISYAPNTIKLNSFNLQPFDTFVYEEDSEGGKNITVESYVSPLRPHVIFFGNSLCDTLISGANPSVGEGPIGMNNYESKKIGEGNFEFTFRFTEIMVVNADTCR
jgi:hypothetical protein